MATLHKRMKYLKPEIISFDENNPRGLSKEQIIGSPRFDKLIESIKEHGLIEPLIVKPHESKPNEFILIDGERRLRASLMAKEDEVPARIAKDDTDGRILAYHAHMLREDWDKAAETKAIKKIIEDLKKVNPNINETEIKTKIREITSHTTHEIADLLKLIKYDDKIIGIVTAGDLDMSYLIHIESNFINPLKKHFQEIIDKYGEDNIREILIGKAVDGNLVNTRFLMDKFKTVFKDRKNSEKIEDLLVKFLDNKSVSIQAIYDAHEKLIKGKKKGKKKLAKEIKKKTKITSTFLPKYIKITKKQQTLLNDVRVKIENIGGSFSEIENEYIAEALHCLEEKCFKAALLMVWSTGIGRILEHIEKDLNDFNNSTDEMKRNKRSAWKHYADNFQKEVNSIEDLRVRSNDTHLLCYLVYKKIISVTQFNALRSNYITRCDCAHPTDIKLTTNSAISVFENIYDYILSNHDIK